MELENENKLDKKIVLPRGLFVYRKKDKLLFTTKEIVFEEVEFSYELPKNGFVKINEVVGSRKSGDKIKLSMGSKKLKQLFIDLKIPKEERDRIPVLQDDNGILCVGNFRNSEEYKVDENTKEVLKICFKKI